MELSGALVQCIDRGKGIFGPSSSLRSSIIGNIHTSDALEQPRHLGLANIKCQEESRFAGSFQSAFGGFSDKRVNDKVDSVTGDPKFEKPVRKEKKNKKKNQKKSYSTKEISDKIISETGQSKSDFSQSCYKL